MLVAAVNDQVFHEAGGWKGILSSLTARRDLTAAQAGAALHEILAGRATPAQTAGFLISLRMKAETVEEVSAMVEVMLATATRIDLGAHGPEAIDIVGTGGSPTRRVHALNVSTMACFVAAGAGARVCKHGNRRASSTSGSFDLLETLGVPVELDGDVIARCVDEVGIGFCFARTFHPAMRHAGPVRSELGVPTVFNFLGPLSNPAGVVRQVVGVSDPRLAPTVIGVLRSRGAPRAMVVHGHDGMDELTTTGPSTIYELRDGRITHYEFDPRDVGIDIVAAHDVMGGDPETNAAIAQRILAGELGPYRDIVVLNAAAGLWAADVVDDLSDGLAAARASIDEGHAADIVKRLITVATAGSAG